MESRSERARERVRTKLFPPGKRKKAGPMSARVYRATTYARARVRGLSGGTRDRHEAEN